MADTRTITCYLCERENRISPGGTHSASVRCGFCGSLLVEVISCPACAVKNRVRIRFVEHQKVACGKCHTVLPTYRFNDVLKKKFVSNVEQRNAQLLQGKMSQWKGEWENAIKQFHLAWKLSEETLEDQVKFSVSLALCHAYLGNTKQAEEHLAALHNVEIDEFTVLYELARAYGLLGKLEEAARCFEDARELLIDSLTIQHIGSLLEILYDLRDADVAETGALQSGILLYDAERDYETENLEAGIQKLQRALEIDAMNPAIYHQLGIGLLRQGRFEEALGILERGLEFDPMHEQAQFALGDAYFHLGMYECAMNAYKQTLHLNPHNIDAYHHLGLIYEKQGEIDIAKGYWEDVLQVNPTHEDAVRCLANYTK